MNLSIEKQRLLQTLAAYFHTTSEHPQAWQGTATSKEVVDLITEMGRLKLMLCGGAIHSIFTGTHVSDLDFYAKDARLLEEIKAFFVEKFLKQFPKTSVYVSPNALTYKRQSTTSRKVWTAQLITRFTGAPVEIFKTFDFTVTQGAFDFETGEFVLGERFLQDIASRKLVYLGGSRFPICAMYRTKKYQARGYSVPGSTIMHISLSIVRLEIKTYKDLKEQLMGIDTMYLANLLNSAKYDDALPVDYGVFLVDAFEEFQGVPQDPEKFEMLWQDNIMTDD